MGDHGVCDHPWIRERLFAWVASTTEARSAALGRLQDDMAWRNHFYSGNGICDELHGLPRRWCWGYLSFFYTRVLERLRGRYVVGFAAAWPINYWLLRNSIKKPCH